MTHTIDPTAACVQECMLSLYFYLTSTISLVDLPKFIREQPVHKADLKCQSCVSWNVRSRGFFCAASALPCIRTGPKLRSGPRTRPLLKVANVSPRDLFSGFTGRAGAGVIMSLKCTVSAYVSKMYTQCLCCSDVHSVLMLPKCTLSAYVAQICGQCPFLALAIG